MPKVKSSEPLRTAGGDELTPELLDTLAEDTERGYDPDELIRRPVGRPSLGDGTSPRLSFRVDGDLYRAAFARAEAEERSISDLAREALAAYIGREEK